MTTTYWGCGRCKVKGSFEHDEHEGFFSAYTTLQDEHVKASPECPERYYIRISLEQPIPDELMELPKPKSIAQRVHEDAKHEAQFDVCNVEICAIAREIGA